MKSFNEKSIQSVRTDGWYKQKDVGSKKIQKKSQKLKTLIEMENSFDRLINRLDIANEKSVRLKIGQQKLSQIKYKKKKEWNKSWKISKGV